MSNLRLRQNTLTHQASFRRGATVPVCISAKFLRKDMPSAYLPRPKPEPRMVVRALSAFEASMGMDPELKKSIDDLIATNRIVVFMKGTRQFPQCGFSNTVVQILNTMDVPYTTVDILADPRLRSGMKEYSQWPTFPQVYISGEFFGGCDIMIEAYQTGELREMLEIALNS